MLEYPEHNEYVIATVRKVMPYGAFCTLDEYNNLEAFVHISEVSSGWVRNIRDHVKEGQKIVCAVIRMDKEKHQIDLSLKRLSEADKKRKLELYNSEKRATKLLERAAIKMGKKLEQAQKEAGALLEQEYGGLYAALEALSQGREPTSKIPQTWLSALTEVAKAEIKPKEVSVRGILTLESHAPNGVEIVKNALLRAMKVKTGKTQVKVHYVGAPTYYVDVVSEDYKTAEKTLDKIGAAVGEHAKELQYSLEKKKT